MGQDHRVPTTPQDLINLRLDRLHEQHRLLRSAARSPTMPIYDADFPLDAVEGQHALRLQADPHGPLEPVTAGWYYRTNIDGTGQWYLSAPGPFVYGGTVGVDGVDAKLTANPHPYADGDTPGPTPFLNGVSNAFYVDALGHVGDGFRYRQVPHGIQLDCSGGFTGVSDGLEIMQLPWGPPTTKADHAAFVDGSGGFYYTLDPDGIFTYVRALA